MPRVPRPAEARALGRRAPTQLDAADPRASTAGSGSAPRRSPGSSTGCWRCSRSSGTSTGGRSTPKGRTLARIYGEGDILVGEALAAGLLDGLAALGGGRAGLDRRLRVARAHAAPGETAHGRTRPSGTRRSERIWRRIRADRGRAPGASSAASSTPGSRRPIFHWAEGEPLEDVLRGDRDGARATSSATASSCSTCSGRSRRSPRRGPRTWSVGRAQAVNRGVVAYTGV